MPENTSIRQPQCPVWIWAILILGLILMYLLYTQATTRKALEIQADIHSRVSQNLVESKIALNVVVSTDGRDITLSGAVAETNQIARIEQIAFHTAGVRQVVTQLSVTETATEEITKNTELMADADEVEPTPEIVVQSAIVERMPEEFAPLENETEMMTDIVKQQLEKLDFSNITFEKGSSSLTAKAQQTLDLVAQALLENPNVEISVEGHTDSSGNPELKLNISRQRPSLW